MNFMMKYCIAEVEFAYQRMQPMTGKKLKFLSIWFLICRSMNHLDWRCFKFPDIKLEVFTWCYQTIHAQEAIGEFQLNGLFKTGRSGLVVEI